MAPLSLSPMANHLWQSTAFAGVAALLALAMHKNRAQIRYCIWLAASIKFLVPFSLLMTAGRMFEWRTAPAPLSSAVAQISQPFGPIEMTASTIPAASVASSLWPAAFTAAWLLGMAVLLLVWWRRWLRTRSAVRSAALLPIEAPIPTGIEVRSSSSRLEPGVFGVFRPVLVLPEDIAGRLTAPQLKAILAHELCHVRRRDNLGAAVHMMVEAIFWFHPLVWWIGARLVEERERACDEEVLRQGSEPEVYAQGILNVCRFYLESPLACASGVTGADLKKRIEAIMTARIAHRLTLARQLMLAVAGMMAVAAPILIGIINAPRIRAQEPGAKPLRFDVASIKPASPVDTMKARQELLPGGGLRVSNVSLMQLITFAYDVPESQVSGAPGWVEKVRYDILAKADQSSGSAANPQGRMAQMQTRERVQSLLAERFNLVVHPDTKEGPVLALVVAKDGPKIQPSKQSEDIPPGTMRSATQINARRGTMAMLCAVLTNWMHRPVMDQTGLTGNYDYVLKYAPDPAESHLFPPESNPPDPAGPSVFTALQEQLGLKLESRKGQVEVIVIDRVAKPTEN